MMKCCRVLSMFSCSCVFVFVCVFIVYEVYGVWCMVYVEDVYI